MLTSRASHRASEEWRLADDLGATLVRYFAECSGARIDGGSCFSRGKMIFVCPGRGNARLGSSDERGAKGEIFKQSALLYCYGVARAALAKASKVSTNADNAD